MKKVVLQKATIVEKRRLSDSAFLIRLESKGISEADFVPGHFIRLAVGLDKEGTSVKDKVRSYSVWNIDTSQDIIDLAVATHSNGIGSKWAEDCTIGDEIYFKWKKGNFLVDDSADSYLMIGDLSALSHLYMINRNLPNKKVKGIIYSSDTDDLFSDIDGQAPFDFYSLPHNPSQELIHKAKELLADMTGKKIVYIAGDSRVCVALNQFFRNELNWETKFIKTKPFWNPAKKGLE
ncbi:siderophore-interacting protein [Algoriphagus winogradskyi]|uniref:siderophore-interacting protein n=1 Tax=Algoriphagus winogradskyi TaxID=237017 RepID=UPI0024B67E2B|nr:siderophore-interacting protein [Algoriphagus winogradskyi]